MQTVDQLIGDDDVRVGGSVVEKGEEALLTVTQVCMRNDRTVGILEHEAEFAKFETFARLAIFAFQSHLHAGTLTAEQRSDLVEKPERLPWDGETLARFRHVEHI